MSYAWLDGPCPAAASGLLNESDDKGRGGSGPGALFMCRDRAECLLMGSQTLLLKKTVTTSLWLVKKRAC